MFQKVEMKKIENQNQLFELHFFFFFWKWVYGDWCLIVLTICVFCSIFIVQRFQRVIAYFILT